MQKRVDCTPSFPT